MLYIWHIEEIIKDTLDKHELLINFESNNDLETPMSYNKSTDTIKFNYLQMNGYHAKMTRAAKVSEEDLVRITLYHQIGYHLDFKHKFYDLRILMYGEDKEQEVLRAKIDGNAWERGRTLVPEELLSSYDKVRELEQPPQKNKA
ncbi:MULTISPECIES: hypothetical protein [Alteribacter]|uniref:Uncharacterized protein n=1 Tax=Alteribacter keqinensis TaxID=2483800 RepID=A0A3M7TQB1_9BACI|nr:MULTISPECIES: hypothetical protein [Alteribacter]MBM7095081.1 hypothetical protein [Alteribacter salitolerans]RNA66869.1 hypothetical protein EBO34_16840 [Alteribacter keqinensis]